MLGTPFYTTAIAPGVMSLNVWDLNGLRRKEVVLRNQMIVERGIAKMNLGIQKMTIVNEAGEEITLKEFQNKLRLTVTGLTSGRNFRTNSVKYLEPGVYTKMRFYVDPIDSTYILANRNVISMKESVIEFGLDLPLFVRAEGVSEAILRFDLAGFEFPGFSKVKRPTNSI